jgi:DNA-binding MarR family transcriptional regulator
VNRGWGKDGLASPGPKNDKKIKEGRRITMALGKETLDAIRTQRRIHETIREKIHPEIPAQQLSIFYLVAENEGITQGEISKHLNMPQATVSRNVLKLASKLVEDRKGNFVDTGYGLVENRDDIVDPRRNAVYTTPKGQEVLKAIARVVATNCTRLLNQP